MFAAPATIIWWVASAPRNSRRHGPSQALFPPASQASRTERTLATVGLRALQARGLLRATRSGRWVRYEPHADPSVRHAADILAMLRAALRRTDDWRTITRAATAFTHPRRIALVQALAARPSAVSELARRCVISPQALYRHLAKLARRNLAVRAADDTWHLRLPPDAVTRDLLRIALCD